MDAGKRPMSVTLAAVLLAVFCIGVDLTFPLWAGLIPRDDGGAPFFIVLVTVGVGVAGLVAAAGLWRLKRWAVWVALVVCTLNILDGAGGMAAPYVWVQIFAGTVVAVFALIAILVILPSSLRASRRAATSS